MASTVTSPTPPLTAHLATMPHPSPAGAPPHGGQNGINLGRDKVNWTHEVWERIDRAVAHEVHRTRVAAKFLPHHRVDPHVTYVPADVVLASQGGLPFAGAAAILVNPSNPPVLNIDDTATTRIIETWVEFSLTPQQVEQENKLHAEHAQHAGEHGGHPGDQGAHPGHPEHGGEHPGHPSHHKHHGFSSAVTLATRAANTLIQAEDTVLFQGSNATQTSVLFTTNLINDRVAAPFDFGLLNIGPAAQNQNLPASQVVAVPAFPPPGPGTNTVQILTISGAVAATTFTLTEGANVTGNIAWSNNNATLVTNIQNALIAVAAIGAGNVAGTAGALINGIGTVQVTFLNALATTASLMTAAVTSGAGTGTVTVGVPARYVENIVRAIDTAYSLLQASGHYGPYAAVLHFYPYADSYSPLPTTLILPADRIRPLMTEGYFGTGTVPGNTSAFVPPVPIAAGFNPTNPTTQSMGLVVSTGGNTMDLVIGLDPVTSFMQVDPNGFYRFRVLERFALRLKDQSAVIRLEFQ
jgi:hypothetical protein